MEIKMKNFILHLILHIYSLILSTIGWCGKEFTNILESFWKMKLLIEI